MSRELDQSPQDREFGSDRTQERGENSRMNIWSCQEVHALSMVTTRKRNTTVGERDLVGGSGGYGVISKLPRFRYGRRRGRSLNQDDTGEEKVKWPGENQAIKNKNKMTLEAMESVPPMIPQKPIPGGPLGGGLELEATDLMTTVYLPLYYTTIASSVVLRVPFLCSLCQCRRLSSSCCDLNGMILIKNKKLNQNKNK